MMPHFPRRLHSSAAHGSLPRQFGAGAMVVVMDHTMLQTAYGWPPSCTRLLWSWAAQRQRFALRTALVYNAAIA